MAFRKPFAASACLAALTAVFAANPVGAQVTNTTVAFQGPGQSFQIKLDANGGQATVEGTGTASVWVPIPLGLGFHQDADFRVDRQTVTAGIVGGSKTFTSQPAGSMVLGVDSATAEPVAMDNTNVNMQNGAPWNIEVTPLVVDIDLTTEIVFIPISFSVDLEIKLTASLQNFRFDDSGPGGVAGGTFGIPGSYIGGLNASVKGKMYNVPILGTYDLGEVASLNEPDLLNQELALFGDIEVRDLEARRHTFPHDLTVQMGTSLSGFSLAFPIAVSDVINESIPVNDGESGIKRVNLNYDVQLNVALSGLAYNLKALARNAFAGSGGYMPFYRNWDAARDFTVNGPYPVAFRLGPDRAWAFGFGTGPEAVFSYYDAIDPAWDAGASNPAWVYLEDIPQPQAGFAKINAKTGGSANWSILTGDLACRTFDGGPSMIQWTAPSGVTSVNVAGLAWDATPGTNVPQNIKWRVTAADGSTVKQTLFQGGISSANNVSAPIYFYSPSVALEEGDFIEVVAGGSPDYFGVQLYVEETVAAGNGRAVGDFDNSGCIDVMDFLFLLDNWQNPNGPITPQIDVIDFLALLDNWNTGPNC